MNNIFLGLIFVFLDFKLNINNSIIDILPDFAGYILMTIGLRKIKDENIRFMRLIPISAFMIMYTLVIYAGDVFVGVSQSLAGIFLTISSDLIIIFITYNIVKAIINMEEVQLLKLSGNNLMLCWGIYAASQLLCYTRAFIPQFPNFLEMLLVIFGFMSAVLFIVMFSITKNKFQSYKK